MDPLTTTVDRSHRHDSNLGDVRDDDRSHVVRRSPPPSHGAPV